MGRGHTTYNIHTHIVPFGKFHRIGGATLKIFLRLSMMPMKGWVATKNVLTALFGKEGLSQLFM